MGRGAARLSYTWKRQDGGERRGECLLSNTSQDVRLNRLMAENRLTSLHSSEPDLNDIFLEITGRALV